MRAGGEEQVRPPKLSAFLWRFLDSDGSGWASELAKVKRRDRDWQLAWFLLDGNLCVFGVVAGGERVADRRRRDLTAVQPALSPANQTTQGIVHAVSCESPRGGNSEKTGNRIGCLDRLTACVSLSSGGAFSPGCNTARIRPPQNFSNDSFNRTKTSTEEFVGGRSEGRRGADTESLRIEAYKE